MAFITTKDGRKIRLPTDEEDAAIIAAAASDPDCPIVTDEQWQAAMPFARIGRPRVAAHKPRVTMRMDADVLAGLRASGKGWQTRVNALLREAVAQGRV